MSEPRKYEASSWRRFPDGLAGAVLSEVLGVLDKNRVMAFSKKVDVTEIRIKKDGDRLDVTVAWVET